MIAPLFIDWQPDIDIFEIGGFSLRWYSFMWCIGLLFAYVIVQKLYKHQKIADEKFEPLFLYCFLGVLIGARLGHCLFYEPTQYLGSLKGFMEMLLPVRFAQDSWEWEFRGYEGLASHGGVIGLTAALLLYVKKTKVPALVVLDNVAIAAPMTSCCIRIGNLMNSEIIGSATDVPWAFLFHTRDALVEGMLVPRHPAQLYEAIAYFIIFIAGAMIYRKYNTDAKNTNHSSATERVFSSTEREHADNASKKNGRQTRFTVGTGFYFGFCLATIFTFRFFVEFIKKEQVDFEQGMLLDMGQLLSIPLIIVGAIFMIGRKRTEHVNK